jgi:hypothetical protein
MFSKLVSLPVAHRNAADFVAAAVAVTVLVLLVSNALG